MRSAVEYEPCWPSSFRPQPDPFEGPSPSPTNRRSLQANRAALTLDISRLCGSSSSRLVNTLWRPPESWSQPQRDVDESDEHRDLDQRFKDAGQRLSGRANTPTDTAIAGSKSLISSPWIANSRTIMNSNPYRVIGADAWDELALGEKDQRDSSIWSFRPRVVGEEAIGTARDGRKRSCERMTPSGSGRQPGIRSAACRVWTYRATRSRRLPLRSLRAVLLPPPQTPSTEQRHRAYYSQCGRSLMTSQLRNVSCLSPMHRSRPGPPLRRPGDWPLAKSLSTSSPRPP